MRFKKSFFAVVLVISVINAVPAIADDSQAARQAAVNRYLKIVQMRKMLEDSAEIAKQIPKEKQEQFLSDMRSIVDADKIEGIARRAMVKTFTVDELNALSDFYGQKTV